MPRLHYDPANDYYALLGLTPRATPAQVQRAFHRLAKEVHPDRNPEDQGRATARFQALNEAYHVLDDPDLRREYDRLRWPHLRFEPEAASGEAWAGYQRTASEGSGSSYSGPHSGTYSGSHGGTHSGTHIDDEWFRQARWEYNNWVRSSPPPPAPTLRTSRAGLSLLALLRGPFGWVYLLLTVTILFMPLIYLAITGWAEQAQTWLHPSVPTAGAATCTALDAIITVPREGARVPTRFEVLGSASPPDLAEYRLELAPLAVPDSPADSDLATARAAIVVPAWVLLAPPAHTPVAAGVLAANVDLAGRAPGVYVLRLSVSLIGGRTLPPCERQIRYDPR